MTVSDQTSVYVGGLAYDVTEDLIRSTFEEFGEIDKVKIIQDHDGQSRGYGFITFATSEAANGAIYGMNGKVVAGRSIRVNEVKNRGGRDSYSYRDRDSRRDREDRRDRYGRYSPKRRRRDRSPYYRRYRSPRDDTSRSVSPSPVSSYDRYDSTKAEKTKTSKEHNGDNSKVKEELAKALELQRDRREQVAALQSDLNRANKTSEEMLNKNKGLEQSLANVTSMFNSHLDYLRQMKQAFADVRNCKEKLRLAEHDLEMAFTDAVLGFESLDPPLPHSNGEIKYLEASKGF
ncbi:cold-inducible RNA-binding protein-like isoform X1 [Selaginella moellendorffii]|uniref:cold-inducible RNA-binding protein-like isoform X1 n=1 Tax=Selaginella moellendorffii TaxID=88036 RepID=UPI000D1C9384|nr:cold-inducible RNA-binding protein-like isoform X1 [Selaginella moellendorffii]XP_024538694.1 cold-inducible RNA-binding protein-like isoform X1 [Selaginella moellendorffii]|eukprot:XP_024538693.1 cold-inducible RNA-binding protein-like isoform X1 [Selaginella moellendorffii]